MRRLVALGLLVASAAAAARLVRERERPPTTTSGNGHSAADSHLAEIRRRLAGAGGRLRDGFDSVRGAD